MGLIKSKSSSSSSKTNLPNNVNQESSLTHHTSIGKHKNKNSETTPNNSQELFNRRFRQFCFFLGWKLDLNSFPRLLHEELIIYIFKICKILFEQEMRWSGEKNKITHYQVEVLRIWRDTRDLSKLYEQSEVVHTNFVPIDSKPIWKIQKTCSESGGFFQIAIISKSILDVGLYKAGNFYEPSLKSNILALLAKGEFGTENRDDPYAEVIFDVPNLTVRVNGNSFDFQNKNTENIAKWETKYWDVKQWAILGDVKEVALCVHSNQNCAPLSVEILEFSCN